MTTRTITRTDYNIIRSTINSLLGAGTGSRGYGQALGSVALPDPPTPVVVQDEQWDALYFDLLNILIHQTGVIPILPNVDSGQVVRLGASYPLSSYESALTTADANRFNLALGQSVIEGKGSQTYAVPWSNQIQATITLSFSTANEARWFFNSGGKVRISSSRTGGSVSAQNTSWTNMLTAAGVVQFGAGTSSSVNFYTLTDTYQTVALYTGSGYYLYSANTYRIEARSNVVNNSEGTATQVTLRLTWADNYVDLKPSLPNDQVDGEISFSVEEQRASGLLKPDGFGAFSVVGPSYTISSITP